MAHRISGFDGGCTPEEIAVEQCPNANVQAVVHTAPHWAAALMVAAPA
jgi:hypothetical protein